MIFLGFVLARFIWDTAMFRHGGVCENTSVQEAWRQFLKGTKRIPWSSMIAVDHVQILQSIWDVETKHPGFEIHINWFFRTQPEIVFFRKLHKENSIQVIF